MTTPAQMLTPMDHADFARCLPTGDEPGFGSLHTARGVLPLRAMDVDVSIVGLVSQVALAQTFVNVHAEPIEATYIFPLPDRAAVTSFRMEVDGRTVIGTLKERGEARAVYDAAIHAGKRAAITEEERPGVFTVRVGNLLPGEAATVRLTLVGPLGWDGEEATFRFPLVVAPRYVPGVALPGESAGDGTAQDTDAAPDASRISPPVLLPGFPSPVRLSLAVRVEPAGLTLGGLRSSLHAVVSEERGGARLVRLLPGERLDRDFILRLLLAGEQSQPSLVLAKDSEGEEGTFALALVPPVGARAAERARDVVFVVDRSGSMSGWKMVCARRAVARLVDALDARDRFAVFAFDDSIEVPTGLSATALVAATDRARFRAVEYLATLESRGGTEMAEPLVRAAKLLAGSDETRERLLVLVTDGQVANEDQLLRALSPRLKHVRAVALGVDRAVNAGFLERLAQLGRGLWALVESEDRLDETMDRVRRMVAAPLLRDVQVKGVDGLSLVPDTLTPARPADLLAGAPLCVSGRFRGAATGALEVTALAADGTKVTLRVPAFVGAEDRAKAVGAVWARARVRDLEDRFVIESSEALEREIVQTSLRFGVLSRFTAFVAVDERVVTRGGQPEKIVQPVEQPSGWQKLEEEEQGAARGAAPGAHRSYLVGAIAPMASIASGVLGAFAPGASASGGAWSRGAAPAMPKHISPPSRMVLHDTSADEYDASTSAPPEAAPSPKRPSAEKAKGAKEDAGLRGASPFAAVSDVVDAADVERRARALLTALEATKDAAALDALHAQAAALVEQLLRVEPSALPGRDLAGLTALLADLTGTLPATWTAKQRADVRERLIAQLRLALGLPPARRPFWK